MIGEVLVLRKCYQCGGETLGPVVKHSVSDSRTSTRPAFDGRRLTGGRVTTESGTRTDRWEGGGNLCAYGCTKH